MSDSPYYHLVPKGRRENMDFREEMVKAGASSNKHAEELWIMCSRDILFWINTFVFGYDPRLAEGGQYPATPFITYGFQDPVLSQMKGCLGKEDVGIEKSRDLGASWMILLVFLHAWLFRDLMSFLLVSRSEALVDKTEDPDSLFWKLDWALKHMPGFMVPAYTRQKLLLSNLDNKSTMTGQATTSDAGVGGRKTAAMLDEFALVTEGEEMLPGLQHTTNSRFVNSTPRGAAGAYYDFMQHVSQKFTLHWSQHPDKRRGLYTTQAGRIVLLEPQYSDQAPHHALENPRGPWYRYNPEFQFVVDDHPVNRWGVRSPWYDHQCDRSLSMADIGQELDIDYHGSDYQFFDPSMLQMLIDEKVSRPTMVGELVYEFTDSEVILNEPETFHVAPKGKLKIWSLPSAGHKYGMGIDVSSGTGASNSCITIGDKSTGEKVASYANPHITGYEFAALAVALAKWFNGAYMIWEAQGPGRPFGKYVVQKFGYLNVYFRRNEESVSRKMSDVPGWYSTSQGKLVLLTDYGLALKRETFNNREEIALEEAKQYIRLISNDTVVHARAAKTKDPSGARSNHGDRVMADALCCRAMGDLPDRPEQERPEALPGSMAYRWDQYQRERKRRRKSTCHW